MNFNESAIFPQNSRCDLMETNDCCNTFRFKTESMEANKFNEKAQVDIHEYLQKLYYKNGLNGSPNKCNYLRFKDKILEVEIINIHE